MAYEKYLNFLQEEIGAVVLATSGNDGVVHSRMVNVGVGNENGVFFMTAPSTDLYNQLEENQNVAITGSVNNDAGFRVIRIEGVVRPLGKEHLEEILKDNPYVSDVYPDEEERASVQAFQIFKGNGNYHHLQDREKIDFEWDLS